MASNTSDEIPQGGNHLGLVHLAGVHDHRIVGRAQRGDRTGRIQVIAPATTPATRLPAENTASRAPDAAL